MNKKLVLSLSLVLVLCLVGVSLFAQTGRSGSSGGGSSKITLYSGEGKVVQEWRVPGQVEVRDGVFTFVDPKTDHQIRISGTVVVDAAP